MGLGGSRLGRKRVWIPAALLALFLGGLLIAWLARESIADDFIADQLAAYDLPATYEIERIGGRRQILRDVVIGDPDAPDFTAERVEVHIRHRIGTPVIERVILTKPRLFGTWRNGELSFGTLDRFLFAPSDEPPGLPDLNVAIRDGRGLIESDYGPVGFKLEGQGNLASGFAGILAIAAPRLAVADCSLDGATLFGKIETSAGVPQFSGPLRLGEAACPEAGLSVQRFAANIDAQSDAGFERFGGDAEFESAGLRYGEYLASGSNGRVRASWRAGVLDTDHMIALRGARGPQALAALLTVDGTLRARDGSAEFETRNDIEGNGLRPGPGFESAMNSLSQAGSGTLIAPLARQMAAALRREARHSALRARFTARMKDKNFSLVMPRAELIGGSGARILALSRVEWRDDADAPPQLAGNIATGGRGLPRIAGRMERSGSGDAVFRLSMAEYSAGGASLAVPRMTVAQAASGALGFSGQIVASGPLPGGSARNLRLPIEGRFVPGGGLTLWRECTRVAFDRLELAQMLFERRNLTLCPPPGSAIVRAGAGGLRIAAGAPSLDLAGTLAGTPMRLRSGPVGFAYPGVLTARSLDIALGPAGTASRFTISDLDARLGKEIAGTFADADITLNRVPLDIRNANGNWRYAGGRVQLTDAGFRLLDRQEPDRFEPLVARDARLTLAENIITAFADMRHPATDRLVTAVDIRHDLSSGRGHADLDVAELEFDNRLQPDQLSRLALGVIANTRGVVTGTGRIDWSERGVTSSGEFSSDDLDFAAAFGPVRGASGTIVFTDLLNLTTAPGQKLRVASVNPGIEVTDGEIEFSLEGGRLLSVAGGSWPFMGGRLILRDVDLNLGTSEARRYVFEIVGLDAGVFVERMDLPNIFATGIFDGTVPIVFDTAGTGRIDEGILISRAPGGNISYVGELTYEDLSPIANFAFDALRSLDYSQMRVVMEGPLTGEIITRVRFDGVSQGEGAKSNFITKRLARLPLQFRINIRAQFYQLITSMKSLYDPASVRDPRELGLLSDDGRRLLRRSITGEEAEPDVDPEDVISDEPPIQD
ncbi:MAG: intermembrane phospholipid transport protein YdbH family protein [Qipengyuania sp.]